MNKITFAILIILLITIILINSKEQGSQFTNTATPLYGTGTYKYNYQDPTLGVGETDSFAVINELVSNDPSKCYMENTIKLWGPPDLLSQSETNTMNDYLNNNVYGFMDNDKIYTPVDITGNTITDSNGNSSFSYNSAINLPKAETLNRLYVILGVLNAMNNVLNTVLNDLVLKTGLSRNTKHAIWAYIQARGVWINECVTEINSL